MLDYHIHLERGTYSEEWLNQFLTIGKNCGIKQFGIVEHLYVFKEAKGLLFQNDHVKPKQIRRINDFFQFIIAAKQAGVPLRLGLEVDYVSEKEDQIKQFVKNLPVDFLIGSVHYLGDWGFDLNSNWSNKDVEEVYNDYFEVLLKAARSGIFDILGHCGNIAYHGHRLSDDVERELYTSFFKKLAKSDIVVEINTGGLFKLAGGVFPQLKYLPLLKELDIKVTTSSDAHDPCYTGWQINKLAIPALRKAGYEQIYSFDKRQRVKVDIRNGEL